MSSKDHLLLIQCYYRRKPKLTVTKLCHVTSIIENNNIFGGGVQLAKPSYFINCVNLYWIALSSYKLFFRVH
jgi:hypothetical protein